MRLLPVLCLLFFFACTATKEVKEVKADLIVQPKVPGSALVDQAIVAKDIRYLASDELGGRGTGSEGIEMA